MKRRANGEGSFFKRKNGDWEGQATVKQVNGRSKRIYASGKSLAIVKEKIRKKKKQENYALPNSKRDWIVADYLDYWIRDIQTDRIRETTMSTYMLAINKYIKPTMGNHKLQEFSIYNVRQALDVLKKQGCAVTMRQKCLCVLSSCLSHAMRDELIHRNVAQLIEKIEYTPKETIIWTTAQAAQFLQAVKNHPHYIAFLLLLTYGMRRGEVLGLRWCDIDFSNDLIHVRQQIGRINGEIMARELKTKNSRRALPLMENVRATLLEYAKKHVVTLPPFNPYFELSTQGTVVSSKSGKPLEPRYLCKCFENLTQEAGLPRIKLHAMRHTAATIIKDLNVPVKDAQMILGHADISTTLNVYQHGTPESYRTAISAVENRLLCGYATSSDVRV